MGLSTAIALVRALHVASALSLLGTAGFIVWILPAASPVPHILKCRLIRLASSGGLAALAMGGAWFVMQTAAMAGAVTLSSLLDALPAVAAHTRYGNVMLVRLALLAVATAVAWFDGAGTFSGPVRRAAAYTVLVLAAIALGLQGLIGHAGATGGPAGDGLVLSESLHLLVAGLWIGALVPLAISLCALTPGQAVAVCERFAPLGLACVLVIAGTGVVQALALIGGVPALTGTRYGQLALLKAGLFLLALALAALNRLLLTDRLTHRATGARRALLISIGLETGIGLGIVAAAAFLAASAPAQQTRLVWPFSWRFGAAVRMEADPAPYLTRRWSQT